MLQKIQFVEKLSEQINAFMTECPSELSFNEVGELYVVLQKIKNNKKVTKVKNVVEEKPKTKTNDIYNNKKFPFAPDYKENFRKKCIGDFKSFSNPDDKRFNGIVASNYYDDCLNYAILEEAYNNILAKIDEEDKKHSKPSICKDKKEYVPRFRDIGRDILVKEDKKEYVPRFRDIGRDILVKEDKKEYVPRFRDIEDIEDILEELEEEEEEEDDDIKDMKSEHKDNLFEMLDMFDEELN